MGINPFKRRLPPQPSPTAVWNDNTGQWQDNHTDPNSFHHQDNNAHPGLPPKPSPDAIWNDNTEQWQVSSKSPSLIHGDSLSDQNIQALPPVGADPAPSDGSTLSANPAELKPIPGFPGQFTDGHGAGGDDGKGNSAMHYGVFDQNGKFLGMNGAVTINGVTNTYGYSYGTPIPAVDLSLPGSGDVGADPSYGGFPVVASEPDALDRYLGNHASSYGGFPDPSYAGFPVVASEPDALDRYLGNHAPSYGGFPGGNSILSRADNTSPSGSTASGLEPGGAPPSVRKEIIVHTDTFGQADLNHAPATTAPEPSVPAATPKTDPMANLDPGIRAAISSTPTPKAPAVPAAPALDPGIRAAVSWTPPQTQSSPASSLATTTNSALTAAREEHLGATMPSDTPSGIAAFPAPPASPAAPAAPVAPKLTLPPQTKWDPSLAAGFGGLNTTFGAEKYKAPKLKGPLMPD